MQTTTNYKLNKPDLTDKVRVQDLNENMDTLDEKVKEIADKSDASSTAVTNLQKKVDTNSTNITSLQTDNTQNKSDIENAKRNISELQDKDGEIENNIDEIETKAESVTQRVGTLEGQYSALHSDVQTAQEKLNKITNPMIIKGTKTSYEELNEVQDAEPGWIYFVGETGAKDYDEYVYTVDNEWEKLGHTEIDLSLYVTNENLETKLGEYATSKSLTDGLAEKADVSALSDYATKQELATKVSVVEQPKENNFAKLKLGNDGKELYFHGSTTPNIPVLKKKTVTGTTTPNGNLTLKSLKAYNSIVLSATETDNVDKKSIIGVPYTGSFGDWYLHVTFDSSPFDEAINKQVGFTVYYLEIPSGYNIPEDTTPASSDEPEDDEGLAPQASYTNEESANYEE